MACERCKGKGYLRGKDVTKRNSYCWPVEGNPQSHYDHMLDCTNFPCPVCRPQEAEAYKRLQEERMVLLRLGLWEYKPKNKYQEYEDDYGKPFPDEYKSYWRH